MKKIVQLFAFLIPTLLHSQVGIGTTAPDNSSILEISSTNTGLLIPRIALTSTAASTPVTTPATSLLVYNTASIADVTPGYYYWSGTAWQKLLSSQNNDWSVSGNNATNPNTNFIGTTDATDLVFRTNNLERNRITANGNFGVGVTNPNYNMEINGSFGFGNGIAGGYRSRTETRNDAGLIASQSGFFETPSPVNFPAGANSWWHLIDSRHSNLANNYAMQIAGSFFDQNLWFRKTNGSANTTWSRLLASDSGWTTSGNIGTNASTNFIGTSDAIDFVTRTQNIERMRVTSAGNVGIGTTPNSLSKFQVNSLGDGNATANWIAANFGASTATDRVVMGTYGNVAIIGAHNNALSAWANLSINPGPGNVGIGTLTPAANAKLQVSGGAIMPTTGNTAAAGIYFPPNPGGGGGDEAYIRHYIEAGENTKLIIANHNDSDDDVAIRTGNVTTDRININGNGNTYINRSLILDCNDCGSTTIADTPDFFSGNWGDLVIQGRVLSTSSNLHLSPPAGNRVIINSTYRAAGGAIGTTGLDIEDGGIRMRKNYRWINRYGSTNGIGWGSQSHNLGSWDFCAVGAFGFRNTNSNTDEDDDVLCTVYPANHTDNSESTQWDSFFTYQYNQRPLWYMYLEGFAETNATTCSALCMNFD